MNLLLSPMRFGGITKLGDSSIGIHPKKPVFMRAQGVLQGGTIIIEQHQCESIF